MKYPTVETIVCTLALAIFSGTTPSSADEMLIARPYQPGKEKLVDNPVDAWMTAAKGPAGKAGLGMTFKKGKVTGFQRYQPSFDKIDATDARRGQFSVTFTVDKPETQSAFGFYPGHYISQWALTPKFSLHFWLKAKAESPVTAWTLALQNTGHTPSNINEAAFGRISCFSIFLPVFGIPSGPFGV